MLIVTLGACLVPRRRSALFDGVTSLALRDHGSPVWLVAVGALVMTLARCRGDHRVTRVAARFEPLRAMRQSAMAALALSMSGERRGEHDLFLVTA